VVFADQRRRLCGAAIELVADCGYDRVTVRALSREAGVSTRTFYRQFANVADCVGFASESTMLCALQRMREAGSAAQDREDGVNAATASLMRYFASYPDAASVVLTEAFDAGPSVLVRLKTVTSTFEQVFADLLSTSPNPAIVPPQLVSGMVAGMLRTARATSVAGRAAELPEFASDISGWMLSLASTASEDSFRPFALTWSGSSSRREATPFPDGRRYGNAAPGADDRERILRATVRLAAADGFASLTIPRIRRVAGVSRQSFNTYFASVPDCFLASLEWLVRAAATRAQAWAASEKDQERRTRRLLLALCAQAARNGALASLVLIGVLDPGRDGLLCRESLLEVGATSIRSELAPLKPVGDLALNASTAAAWQIASAEVAAGRTSRLPGISPLLAHVILAPTRPLESRHLRR
jgi:AcrR family transcriptional regulator